MASFLLCTLHDSLLLLFFFAELRFEKLLQDRVSVGFLRSFLEFLRIRVSVGFLTTSVNVSINLEFRLDSLQFL